MITTENDTIRQEEKQEPGSNSEKGSIAISEANEDVQQAQALDTPIGGSHATRGDSWFTKAWEILNWMPKRCRYDSENPPSFTLGMNILLGFVRLASFFSLLTLTPLIESILN